MKTDPKNHDYICEAGATRNYEAWRDARAAENTLKELRHSEEEGNAMRFLENRTSDSKREMDILEALDEMKNMSRQNAKVSDAELMHALNLKNDCFKDILGDDDYKYMKMRLAGGSRKVLVTEEINTVRFSSIKFFLGWQKWGLWRRKSGSKSERGPKTSYSGGHTPQGSTNH
jgi:hypothetical protein